MRLNGPRNASKDPSITPGICPLILADVSVPETETAGHPRIKAMTEALSVKHELDGKQFILFEELALGKLAYLMLDRFPNIEHVYMVVRVKNKDGSIQLSLRKPLCV